MRPRFLPLTLILLAALLLPSPQALAATKLDLTPYLGQMRTPGDFKIYAWDTGGQSKVTTLEVQPWSKGGRLRTTEEITGTGDSDGVVTRESYLIPGRQLFGGSQFFEGISIEVSKPTKGLKLFGAFGKVQRLKSKAALVAANGVQVGDVLRLGAWAAEGYENVTTPSGTYTAALRGRAFSGVGIYDAFGELVFFYDEVLWYAPAIGLVKVDTYFERWENGVRREARFWTESLSSYSLSGIL